METTSLTVRKLESERLRTDLDSVTTTLDRPISDEAREVEAAMVRRRMKPSFGS